jgi:hypothetical protein
LLAFGLEKFVNLAAEFPVKLVAVVFENRRRNIHM